MSDLKHNFVTPMASAFTMRPTKRMTAIGASRPFPCAPGKVP
jgi:hypothetical protein